MVMNSDVHFMGRSANCQILKAVKGIAWTLIPFANRDLQRRDEFRRVWKRWIETVSNHVMRVWHDFSCSIFEVRRVGTIGRKNRL